APCSRYSDRSHRPCRTAGGQSVTPSPLKKNAGSLRDDHIFVTCRIDHCAQLKPRLSTRRGQMKSQTTDRLRPRRPASLAMAAILAATFLTAHAIGKQDDNDQGSDQYTVGLFGDMPYNDLGRAQYPALLADINRAHVAFSVHDGDLKAGGDGPCADSLYFTALDYFNSLERPLIFVPGDNDWTDCWGRYGPATAP